MARNGIAVSVECVDALERGVELLVLKHAQALYGVDRAAVARLGVSPRDLPAVGDHLLVEGRGTGAEWILFLGVPALNFFGYGDVRRFAQRALAVARQVRPGVREIAMTLHGTGFGLDETEAFEAEVGGLVDAVTEGLFPDALATVVFLQNDPHAARRMSDGLLQVLPLRRIETVDATVEQRLRSVGDASGQRGHAFVAMPFSEEFEDAFHFGISPAVREAGLLCERMDLEFFTGDIVGRMRQRIADARLVVADLTGANPNVYLEVGYAWGCGVPTVLVRHHAADLAFDVKGHRCLSYVSIRDLQAKLTKEIAALIG